MADPAASARALVELLGLEREIVEADYVRRSDAECIDECDCVISHDLVGDWHFDIRHAAVSAPLRTEDAVAISEQGSECGERVY